MSSRRASGGLPAVGHERDLLPVEQVDDEVTNRGSAGVGGSGRPCRIRRDAPGLSPGARRRSHAVSVPCRQAPCRAGPEKAFGWLSRKLASTRACQLGRVEAHYGVPCAIGSADHRQADVSNGARGGDGRRGRLRDFERRDERSSTGCRPARTSYPGRRPRPPWLGTAPSLLGRLATARTRLYLNCRRHSLCR